MSLKRSKMAWMLRELFDYRILPQEQKKDAIDGLYEFIINEPHVFGRSIAFMEKAKDKLRERCTPYKASCKY